MADRLKTDWKSAALFLLLIAVLTAWTYRGALQVPFHLDDFHSIVNNPHVQTLSNVPAYFTSSEYFSTHGSRQNMYRPVLLSTYALNYWWGELEPWGYHLVNLLIHLMTAWAVFALVHQVLRDREAALISAFIFALHPLTSEVLIYVSARSSAAATLFYLLAVYFFLIFRENQARQAGRSKTLVMYFLFLGSFASALMCKEIALTLPIVIALADLLILRIRTLQDFLRKSLAYLPFFLIAVLFSLRIDLWSILIQTQYATLDRQIQVLFKAPWLFFYLTGLSADHPIVEPAPLTQPAVFVPFLLLTGLFVWGIALGRSRHTRDRGLAFWIFWFFVTSLPTTLFQLNQAFMEHRGYLPLVGVIALASAAVLWGVEQIQKRVGFSPRVILPLVIFALLFVFIPVGVQRTQAWQDEISLWSDVVDKYPDSRLGRFFLAVAYQRNGEPEKALPLHRHILQTDPDCRHVFTCSKAHLNLGFLYQKDGQWEDALREYHETLRWVPDSYLVRYRIGTVYHNRGDLDNALHWYQEALKRREDAYEVHYALGALQEASGNFDLARKEYETAFDLNPAFLDALIRLGGVLIREDRLIEARKVFEEVLLREPTQEEAYHALGYIAEKQGDFDEAIEQYQALISKASSKDTVWVKEAQVKLKELMHDRP